MTVRDLINELENYDGNMEVVMKPSNSNYVDGILGVGERGLRAFFGENRRALVITSGSQEGAV